MAPASRAKTGTRLVRNQLVAEAEHGGFFQAAADGTYKAYGLDVTCGVPGGRTTTIA